MPMMDTMNIIFFTTAASLFTNDSRSENTVDIVESRLMKITGRSQSVARLQDQLLRVFGLIAIGCALRRCLIIGLSINSIEYSL